jgi:ribose transport system permease protein
MRRVPVQRFLTQGFLRRCAPLLVLIALCLAFTLINPNFLSVRNFARIGILAAPTLLVAVGVTFIIIMGSIDLSMEGVVAFCAVAFAKVFVTYGGFHGWGWTGIPLAVLVGAFAGLLGGLAHVRLRIPSFMSSLSMGYIGLGATFVLSGGYRINVQDPIFRSLLTQRLFEMPYMVYFALLGLLFAVFIERFTVVGRNIFAVGGGEELARASGLDVARVRVLGFVIAGAFYGLGALLAVARVGIADGSSGSNLMFTAITAVVVGGTSLIGGHGGVLNTLIGTLIVAAISNGMIVIGLPSYVQSGVLGLIVIIAVALSTNRKAIRFIK